MQNFGNIFKVVDYLSLDIISCDSYSCQVYVLLKLPTILKIILTD
jgi:hypothetical protein